MVYSSLRLSTTKPEKKRTKLPRTKREEKKPPPPPGSFIANLCHYLAHLSNSFTTTLSPLAKKNVSRIFTQFASPPKRHLVTTGTQTPH